jgi:hypothetical protein
MAQKSPENAIVTVTNHFVKANKMIQKKSLK